MLEYDRQIAPSTKRKWSLAPQTLRTRTLRPHLSGYLRAPRSVDTAKMGIRALAVINARLEVYGIDKLWIVDASCTAIRHLEKVPVRPLTNGLPASCALAMPRSPLTS